MQIENHHANKGGQKSIGNEYKHVKNINSIEARDA
jgi:hypothetical protein